MKTHYLGSWRNNSRFLRKTTPKEHCCSLGCMQTNFSHPGSCSPNFIRGMAVRHKMNENKSKNLTENPVGVVGLNLHVKFEVEFCKPSCTEVLPQAQP